MLNNLTLENFKAFQKLDNLKIKPITILCGTNSCGKSSILQSILLMKQTLENKNPKQNLLLNGRFTQLGYFEDLVYQKNKDNVISMSLFFDTVAGGEFAAYTEGFFSECNFQLKITLNLKNEIIKIKDVYLDIHFFDEDSEENEELESIKISVEQKENDEYYLTWSNIEVDDKREGESFVDISFSNLLKLIVSEKEKLDSDSSSDSDTDFLKWFLKRRKFEDISNIFSILNDQLKEIYSKYTYIGPLRGEPEREYIYRDEVIEIGNKGENAAFLYLSEKEKEIQKHFFYNVIKDSFEQSDTISIKDALNKWLTLMNIENFDSEIINRIIYLSQNASKYDKTKVGIADVGFGVSQIFPILLEGLRMEKGGTLLLEQPEIHLHPDLQMQMADYFVSLALSDKNVLVETHSDHIIHRLVRRIVEDEEYDLKDKIAIYFIKPSENGAVYEEINIDETKGITNWPTNFFDQAANEQMRIMQAGLKKRKHLRNNSKS